MSRLKKLLSKEIFIAVLILIVANIVLFWQFYFKGLLPFPGDLLVSFFFPWNSGGFAGFDPWTTHKELNAADVLRQMYPWKEFAFGLIRHGQLPLWNPYNFSGYPLVANLQSSIFFIGNVLFLFLPTLWAWIGLVISLPFIFSLFMYFFLRSLKLSLLASAFGAIAAFNVSHIMIWHEQLIITQAVLFLPLMLWSINKYVQTKRPFYYLLVPVFLAFSIFGGHIQTTIYVSIIVFVYALFSGVTLKKVVLLFFLAAALAAVQLIPTAEIYLASAREGEDTRRLFVPFILPWSSLVTILIPDFFGNPATGNFWGKNYSDFQIYSGMVATIFAVFSIFELFKNKLVRLFLFLGIGGLIFAAWPLAYLPHLLNIPILATGVPARAALIFQFSLVILGAIGLDHWQKNHSESSIKKLLPALFIGLIISAIWLFVLFQSDSNYQIAKRNLFIPSSIYFATLTTLTVSMLKPLVKMRSLIPLIFIGVALMGYTYFFNKSSPFSPIKFVFPNHRVFNFLEEKAGVNRFYGVGSAYLDSNFATKYGVYAPEGYDSLYIKRYGELLAASANGKIPKGIPRSDALFTKDDTTYRHRLFDILGVKYILDKVDTPTSNWEPELPKFPLDQYQLAWQSNKWKAYERKSAFPRAFVVANYEVISGPNAIIARLLNPNFSPKDAVILEEPPPVKTIANNLASAVITSYEPSKVIIKVSSAHPALLFLSDTYFPGWQAFVNGQDAKIYRADYAFRAVSVPGGDSEVIFIYDPWSFKIGAVVSIVSFLTLSFILISKRKK